MAAISRRDRHHRLCRELLESHRGAALVVPITVAVEVDYLVRSRLGSAAARAFLADLDEGPYVLEPVTAGLVARARAIDARHADADLGLVDASVVAVAERLGAGAVLTLDHADLRLAAEGGTWQLLPHESAL